MIVAEHGHSKERPYQDFVEKMDGHPAEIGSPDAQGEFQALQNVSKVGFRAQVPEDFTPEE